MWHQSDMANAHKRERIAQKRRAWNPHEVRQLAVLAGVDPRTARRWLSGQQVTSTCAARLGEALHSLHKGGGAP